MDTTIVNGMKAQFLVRAEALAAGETQIGWKSAFGSPAAMEKMGISTPLVGFMTDKNQLETGAAIDVSGWKKPAIEMEMAITIASDLPDGLADAGAAADAIAGLGPAFEIVDLFGSLTDLEEILSANIYHRHVILGPMDASRAGGRTDGLRGLIAHNDAAPVEEADVEANSGPPLGIVIGVANHLRELGEYLRKDDVVICGSIVPPIFAKAGDSVTYELNPFAPLTVSLT
ncbi:MAG: hypothetical protein O7G83_15035 [Proteobacteria bacterium]|nr:hypothetical protein [Pseudomonadota bacterium]